MHVVYPVVHDGGGDVLPGDALRPRGCHVEVQLGLAAVLASVLQVPLVLEERVRGVGLGGEVHQVLNLQRVVAPLVAPEGKKSFRCSVRERGGYCNFDLSLEARAFRSAPLFPQPLFSSFSVFIPTYADFFSPLSAP